MTVLVPLCELIAPLVFILPASMRKLSCYILDILNIFVFFNLSPIRGVIIENRNNLIVTLVERGIKL